MNNSEVKKKLIEIFEKAKVEEGEAYIYFGLETPNGLIVKTCVKDFEVDYDYNDYISINGYEEKDENNYEMVRIPLLNIVSININIEEDEYKFFITYLDKTKLSIEIP